MASQILAHRSDYYDMLEATQKGNLDYTAWLNWYLMILHMTLDAATETVSQAIGRAQFWQAAKDVPLNDRQRKAVSRMLMGWEGRMTNRKYASLCDCSAATATRDLIDLVDKSIFRLDGAGGRSTGYELVKSGPY
jgi:Fic family protein